MYQAHRDEIKSRTSTDPILHAHIIRWVDGACTFEQAMCDAYIALHAQLIATQDDMLRHLTNARNAPSPMPSCIHNTPVNKQCPHCEDEIHAANNALTTSHDEWTMWQCDDCRATPCECDDMPSL